ncbi:acyl-CoA desaturase [Leeia sp. TBRC 13508]|uniref:Acyl-CoA desaturase n=1 Tax=Leeia speluncae TaxID=2884804 RepID=A0ABS8D191_9NEIS|nr:acyl-CoA desaturase [Leeia speluncae]MCB6181962.1 acyl-CoA desaturase [Leeia speluncae]
MSEHRSTRIIFPPRGVFFNTLKARVDAYFHEREIKQTGNAFLYFKTLFSYALLIGSYLTLVFGVESWWAGMLAAFGVVQGFVMVAFNVMHDGAHGSYSRKSWPNWLAGASMDFIGSSQMLWKQKHNMLHHTYTNIEGKDDDIAIGSLMRLSPEQPLKPWHRFQHWYAPVLYSLLTLYLAFYSDWQKIITNKIGDTPLQPRKGWEIPYFLFAKCAYVGYALVLPMLFHPVWKVLLFFVGIHLLFGLTLSLVFQLAHTVEGASFPTPAADSGKMENEWAVHQVKTTADFAPTNKLASFYMGGLNFQVEHHLFHKISHVHYPEIRRIVKETCEEFSVPYLCFPSVRSAIAAHFRFLKSMGKPALSQ